jgi:catechol 2,3-dioxygenase-like lactoylglutathione lyase family enzyme
MKLKISDYCLIVQSVEKSVHFYKDIVGLPMRLRNENFADFDLGKGVHLALWEHGHVSPVIGLENAGVKGNRTMGAIRLNSCEEVDELSNQLQAKGVNFLEMPKMWVWGAYAAYFTDPDGNLWEIYHWAQAAHTI